MYMAQLATRPLSTSKLLSTENPIVLTRHGLVPYPIARNKQPIPSVLPVLRCARSPERPQASLLSHSAAPPGPSPAGAPTPAGTAASPGRARRRGRRAPGRWPWRGPGTPRRTHSPPSSASGPSPAHHPPVSRRWQSHPRAREPAVCQRYQPHLSEEPTLQC